MTRERKAGARAVFNACAHRTVQRTGRRLSSSPLAEVQPSPFPLYKAERASRPKCSASASVDCDFRTVIMAHDARCSPRAAVDVTPRRLAPPLSLVTSRIEYGTGPLPPVLPALVGASSGAPIYASLWRRERPELIRAPSEVGPQCGVARDLLSCCMTTSPRFYLLGERARLQLASLVQRPSLRRSSSASVLPFHVFVLASSSPSRTLTTS